MASSELSWVEVDRWSVRRCTTGARVEVVIEKFGHAKSPPHRVRVVEVDVMGPGRNYEYVCAGDDDVSLAVARERGRRALIRYGSRILDNRAVICEASVPVPKHENVPWPGPILDEPFYLGSGGGPAFDRMLAEMVQQREAIERHGLFSSRAAEQTKPKRRSKRREGGS